MNNKDFELFQQMIEMLDNEAGVEVSLEAYQLLAKQYRSALLDTGVDLAGSTYAEYLGQDERSAFYYVPVPLTVHPVKGTYFESIQIRLILNPGLGFKPTVHDIFPAQRFHTIVKAEGTVHIGINDVFEFVSVVLGGNVAVQLAKTLIKITSLDDLKVDRKYSYLSREAIIQTSPPHSDIAQWILHGRDLFEQEQHVELGFVLQVPLDLDHVVVAREISARKRNNSIRTRLLEDMKRLEGMRNFIQRTFGEPGFDALNAVKAYLQNSFWNVIQKDLPAWKLDNDLVHTYD